MRYGGYALKVGDRDAKFVYAGEVRSADNGQVVPAVGEFGFVRQLQHDLTELGFRLVGTPDGIFGRHTAAAVREFQIYSKMERLAYQGAPRGRYSSSLESVKNPHVYEGPISGVANEATRIQLMNWIDHRFRCPVVVESWLMRKGKRSVLLSGENDEYKKASQNLWRHDEIPSNAPRMFVRDLTGYYAIPAAHTKQELLPLGDFTRYLGYSGPRAIAPLHTWPEAEMLPENLVGVELDSLTAAQRSTYKVIRAVAEVECQGFYDCMNAYDNAIISLGPCHWTLGIVGQDGAVERGELCAFLAYLKQADNAAFNKACGFFGVGIDRDWTDSEGRANGANLWQAGSRKYTGWVTQQQEDGSYLPVPRRADAANYFKHWHWFYRLSMAGRTIAGFQRCMYDFARLRLRDLLATPFCDDVPDLPNGVTIGDVYTSERALALLLRWHIRYPARVARGGQVASEYLGSRVGVVQTAFENAQLQAPPGDWGDAEERSLVGGLLLEVDKLGNRAFLRTMQYVNSWPTNWGDNPRGYQLPGTVGRLSDARDSFAFDHAALPPAP